MSNKRFIMVNVDGFLQTDSENFAGYSSTTYEWVNVALTAMWYLSLNYTIYPIASSHRASSSNLISGRLPCAVKATMLRHMLQVPAFTQNLMHRVDFSDDELRLIVSKHNSCESLMQNLLLSQAAVLPENKRLAADCLLENAHAHFIFWENTLALLETCELSSVCAPENYIRSIYHWISIYPNSSLSDVSTLNIELNGTKWLPSIAACRIKYDVSPQNVFYTPDISIAPYKDDNRAHFVEELSKIELRFCCIPKRRTPVQEKLIEQLPIILSGSNYSCFQREKRYRGMVETVLVTNGLHSVVQRANSPKGANPILFSTRGAGVANAYIRLQERIKIPKP